VLANKGRFTVRGIILYVIILGFTLHAGHISAAEKKDTSGRELCILYTEQCSERMHRLQEKIHKIQSEIARGATVYNPAEIDKLEMKLKDAEDQMDEILSTPDGFK
jgi:hypothetical protein